MCVFMLLVMQPELYIIMEILFKISYITTYILHANNWLIYALSMKKFRDDMKMLINGQMLKKLDYGQKIKGRVIVK